MNDIITEEEFAEKFGGSLRFVIIGSKADIW